jgi:nitroreductase
MTPDHATVPLDFRRMPPGRQIARARAFLNLCRTRRSVRHFSAEPVPRAVIEDVIATAGCAPSGANMQPWKFVVVDDGLLKRAIREAAEREERENYERRMPAGWLEDLAPLGTDWRKEFLETAPVLIVVFRERYRVENGRRRKNYYVEESVGIACGFLLAALHHAGLVALTHTPAPMEFLGRILRRPAHEAPCLLIPVGYPADGARVPAIPRKPLHAIMTWNV